MAEQRSEEVDDGLAHAGGIEDAAQKDENRDRQQDKAGHTLVHASDHDEDRDLRGEGKIAQRADAETECDGNASNQARRNEDNEKENDLAVAEPDQGWRD